MKLFLAAVAAAFLLPRADTLALSVKQGEKVSKTIEIALALESKRISISIGGKELPEDVLSKFSISMANEYKLALEDEYTGVEKDRATGFVRRFRETKLRQQGHEVLPGGKPKEKDDSFESPLSGKAVEFRWNAKDARWDRALEGGGGEKEWLEVLDPDMDLSALLHAGVLEEGAKWKIDAAHFVDLVKPGGELSFPEKNDTNVKFDLWRHPTGTLEATYAGTRELEGHAFAVVKLEAHVKTVQEPDPGSPQPLALESSVELEGEYLFDLEHHRFASYTIGGPATLVASGTREIDAKGQKATMQLRFEFGGELKAKGRFE